MRLREIDTGLKDPAWNISSDHILLNMQSENKIPATLRFLSFNPSSVLVGYFQSLRSI